MHSFFLIKNARLLKSGRADAIDLVINSQTGLITAIGENLASSLGEPFEIIDASSLWITPGLIDLQINGAFGYEFADDPSLISQLSRLLPSYGVTSFLPTIISRQASWYEEKFLNYDKLHIVPCQAQPIGWHFEGPFLNPLFAGIHSQSYLAQQVCDEAVWERIFSRGDVSLLTIAPEMLEGRKCLDIASSFNVPVAIGHTGVQLTEEMKKYLKERGVVAVTHLFNAMQPFHHREPLSVLSQTLGERAFPFYSLIVDGCHLSEHTIAVANSCHPDGLIVVSDGSPLIFSKSRTALFAGKKIAVDTTGKRAVDEEKGKTLSGSIIPLHQQIKILSTILHRPFIELVIENACRASALLGIDTHLGAIKKGYKADLVLWKEDNESYLPEITFIDGKIAFIKEG